MNQCDVLVISFTCILFSSPAERTSDDLEIIYEELLHIKALSHLSTTVSATVNPVSDPQTLDAFKRRGMFRDGQYFDEMYLCCVLLLWHRISLSFLLLLYCIMLCCVCTVLCLF